MSEEKGNIDWTKILRQAGGPQNLSPIATAKVFLLSAMLREERKRRETSNGSNGVSGKEPLNSPDAVVVVKRFGFREAKT